MWTQGPRSIRKLPNRKQTKAVVSRDPSSQCVPDPNSAQCLNCGSRHQLLTTKSRTLAELQKCERKAKSPCFGCTGGDKTKAVPRELSYRCRNTTGSRWKTQRMQWKGSCFTVLSNCCACWRKKEPAVLQNTLISRKHTKITLMLHFQVWFLGK